MRVWDFDGVIFNSAGDYTDTFLTNNQHNRGLVATLPPLFTWDGVHMDWDVLVTGRGPSQKLEVWEILAYNNIRFAKVIFSPFTAKDYKKKTFMAKYYAWKAGILRSDTLGSVRLVIDDDPKVLAAVSNSYPVCHVPHWLPDLRAMILNADKEAAAYG